jgi:hypothetical protein
MVIAERELEPLKPDAPRMSDYMRERRQYERKRKQETAALRERHRLEQEAAWYATKRGAMHCWLAMRAGIGMPALLHALSGWPNGMS